MTPWSFGRGKNQATEYRTSSVSIYIHLYASLRAFASLEKKANSDRLLKPSQTFESHGKLSHHWCTKLWPGQIWTHPLPILSWVAKFKSSFHTGPSQGTAPTQAAFFSEGQKKSCFARQPGLACQQAPAQFGQVHRQSQQVMNSRQKHQVGEARFRISCYQGASSQRKERILPNPLPPRKPPPTLFVCGIDKALGPTPSSRNKWAWAHFVSEDRTGPTTVQQQVEASRDFHMLLHFFLDVLQGRERQRTCHPLSKEV